MLHTGTVEAGTLALVKKLSNDENLKQFNLVGGTALSLMIGHRLSVDIDLFSSRGFNAKEVAGYLQKEYSAYRMQSVNNAVFSYIEGVKVDILTHEYKWLNAPNNVEGIRMTSLDDIAAMKIHAVIQSGQRLKDFVDIHFLLEYRTMDQMMQAYLTKYPGGNAEIARMALLYHRQVDFNFPVKLIGRETKWPDIAARLKQAVLQPGKIFSENKSQAKLRQEQKERNLRRNRGRSL